MKDDQKRLKQMNKLVEKQKVLESKVNNVEVRGSYTVSHAKKVFKEFDEIKDRLGIKADEEKLALQQKKAEAEAKKHEPTEAEIKAARDMKEYKLRAEKQDRATRIEAKTKRNPEQFDLVGQSQHNGAAHSLDKSKSQNKII